MVFRIPGDDDSLISFGESRSRRFAAPHLRVLVWNVWKGRKGAAWRRDFQALSADRDLILLQEAVTAPEMSSLFHSGGEHEWHMAASFQWRQTHMTGVITGALASPLSKRFLRGTERELFLWTPKVSLGTHYDIEGRGSLLVINTHVVNFTTTSAFVNFVRELLTLIESHQGPVLLAGDFNTWSVRRWLSLCNILIAIGLQPVDFHADPRVMKLDHVFIRGLRVVEACVRGDVRSSDHFPLLAEFEVV